MSCACTPAPAAAADARRPSLGCLPGRCEELEPCQTARLRRAFGQRGASASLYAATLGALAAHQPSGAYWHGASDRAARVGGGVDVKHGSYARYLAKRTAPHYKSTAAPAGAAPRACNKTRKVGLVAAGGCGRCT
jgi:hypothetical protein